MSTVFSPVVLDELQLLMHARFDFPRPRDERTPERSFFAARADSGVTNFTPGGLEETRSTEETRDLMAWIYVISDISNRR